MTELGYVEARARAIARELDANPEAFLIGGAVSLPFNPDDGLGARYPDRIHWPPISEFAAAAAGVGAAIAGMRPLVPLSTASFMFYGWAPIVNEAPNVRYLSGGATSAPVAFHVMGGSRRSSGPQHEHTPQAMLQNIPGLRVHVPATPADIDAAIHAALTGPDPTVIVDHVLLADVSGAVPVRPAASPAPALLREGGEVLVVAAGVMTQRALAAAGDLDPDGERVSVLNLATLTPLPFDLVAELAASHAAVVFVEESRLAGSPASALMAGLLERGIDTPARLVCTVDAPAPFATDLLDAVVPTTARIAAAVREVAAGRGPRT
ncbi:MAG TPA: transketolase C-terminal domain-containing protein [Solirubrobacterales bacterium]|nr:transketolase C-terminal domain-containing protein [Solirubrobacterales bacterium]